MPNDEDWKYGNLENFQHLIQHDFVISTYAQSSHWYLFVANMREHLFYFIDPKVAYFKTKGARFKTWKELLQLSLTSFKESERQNGELTHTKQSDSINCGVICLMAIEQIVKQNNQLEFDDKTLITYRQFLIDLLLSEATLTQ